VAACVIPATSTNIIAQNKRKKAAEKLPNDNLKQWNCIIVSGNFS